jgi:hypothetical protein
MLVCAAGTIKTMRRRGLAVVFDYVGVLLFLLVGVVCLGAGLVRDEVALLVVGGVIAIIAVIWAVVFRAKGGSLVP